MSKKKKYYVVWEGHNPGVYESWSEAERQIRGFKNASFKSFGSLKDAQIAFKSPEKAADLVPAGKKRYYVVWRGRTPGIYKSWVEAREQISEFPKPKFKSFGSLKLAEKAFKEGPENYEGRSFKKSKDLSEEELKKIGDPILMSLSVDAACNSKTGVFEYRGVITESGTEVFKEGPFKNGTNNVGEFLALVHALAYLKKEQK